MTIKNVVIDTEPKTRKPYTKKVKPENLESNNTKKYFCDYPIWQFINGDNSGEGGNISKLLKGKKLKWKKIYEFYMTGEGVGKPYVHFETKNKPVHPSPHWVVFNNKTKEIVFDEVSNFGKGFMKMIEFLNDLK